MWSCECALRCALLCFSKSLSDLASGRTMFCNLCSSLGPAAMLCVEVLVHLKLPHCTQWVI